MSLLMSNSNVRLASIARKVFDQHFKDDPQLNEEYDDRRKKLMYDDIIYNLGYLDAAIQFDDTKLFGDYAVWLYQLMCYIMKDLDRNRIKDQLIMHYELLNKTLAGILSEEEAERADRLLKRAIDLTEKEALQFSVSDRFELGEYVELKKKYLDFLMNNDTRGAYEFIDLLHKTGYKLEEIYIEILQEVMHKVGDMWHRQEISIDKEHYCTSTTQVILSHFYPVIFSSMRNGCKLLSCCVGSELHEMGARMLSDLFEYNGWESVYLGAAVPNESIIKAIDENKPDLIALSVTMPQYLPVCYEIVEEIRKNNQNAKIAVGGRGFQMTDNLWKKWDVDISTENAVQLIEWAKTNILNKKRDAK